MYFNTNKNVEIPNCVFVFYFRKEIVINEIVCCIRTRYSWNYTHSYRN